MGPQDPSVKSAEAKGLDLGQTDQTIDPAIAKFIQTHADQIRAAFSLAQQDGANHSAPLTAPPAAVTEFTEGAETVPTAAAETTVTTESGLPNP